jgi:hypothetical protein
MMAFTSKYVIFTVKPSRMVSNVNVKLVSDISVAVFIIRGVVSARFVYGVPEAK